MGEYPQPRDRDRRHLAYGPRRRRQRVV
jgi:hypothetical protein